MILSNIFIFIFYFLFKILYIIITVKIKMTTTKLRKTKRTTTKRRKTKRTTTKRRKTKRTTTKRRKTKRTTTKRRKTKLRKRRKTTRLKRTLKGGQNLTIKATNGSSIMLQLNNKTKYTLETADDNTGNSTVCKDIRKNPAGIEFYTKENDIILKVDHIEYGKLYTPGHILNKPEEPKEGILITSAPTSSCLTNGYYKFASFDANLKILNAITIVLKKHMFTVTDTTNKKHQLEYYTEYTLVFPQPYPRPDPVVTFKYKGEKTIDIISDELGELGDIIVNSKERNISAFSIENAFFKSVYPSSSTNNYDTDTANIYNITSIDTENKKITLE